MLKKLTMAITRNIQTAAKNHTAISLVLHRVKKVNHVVRWDTLQKKCRSPLSNHTTGNSRFNKRVNYHAKSDQLSEWEKGSCQLGIYFASSLVGMAAACKTVVIDGTEMKMHMDTGADTTMIWSTI